MLVDEDKDESDGSNENVIVTAIPCSAHPEIRDTFHVAQKSMMTGLPALMTCRNWSYEVMAVTVILFRVG